MDSYMIIKKVFRIFQLTHLSRLFSKKEKYFSSNDSYRFFDTDEDFLIFFFSESNSKKVIFVCTFKRKWEEKTKKFLLNKQKKMEAIDYKILHKQLLPKFILLFEEYKRHGYIPELKKVTPQNFILYSWNAHELLRKSFSLFQHFEQKQNLVMLNLWLPKDVINHIHTFLVCDCSSDFHWKWYGPRNNLFLESSRIHTINTTKEKLRIFATISRFQNSFGDVLRYITQEKWFMFQSFANTGLIVWKDKQQTETKLIKWKFPSTEQKLLIEQFIERLLNSKIYIHELILEKENQFWNALTPYIPFDCYIYSTYYLLFKNLEKEKENMIFQRHLSLKSNR